MLLRGFSSLGDGRSIGRDRVCGAEGERRERFARIARRVSARGRETGARDEGRVRVGRERVATRE